MKIFHRIDDVGIYSDQMVEILNFFENNTKEFIIAVVPKTFDKRYVSFIKEYNHCSIYQHGFEHQNHVERGWCDEFPDYLDYQYRLSLISEGKKKIEQLLGYEIRGYVPPWNNTGSETIKIISELGFSVYSAQKNNTVDYQNNRDISIDIIKEYTPTIVYKDLDQILCEIINKKSEYDEIGIMYHFRDTKSEEWEKIKKFIKQVEELNSI